MSQRVTVFGAGAWGSTMAQVLHDAGNEVLLWGRNHDVVDEINTLHTNHKYLEKHVLPVDLKATSDLSDAFAWSSIYILAIPAQQLRNTLAEWKPLYRDGAIVVSTLKGIEISTQMRMSEIIEEVWGAKRVAVITGPKISFVPLTTALTHLPM
jgi:glycerol-3-phosphate dehydrogenase (NAD(P)+)